MTPTYNETYVITLAFVDQFFQPADHLASLLQLAYDSGNVAGFFEWQRLGRVTVLEFERQIGEDTEVLAHVGREMTPDTVVRQLAYELREAQEQAGLAQEEGLAESVRKCRNDAYNLVTTIAEKLEAGGEDVKVAGLLCQMPRVIVTIELAYENKASREAVEQAVQNAVERLANALQGEVIAHKMEKP